MSLSGPQALAARALIEWPLDRVARQAGVDADVLEQFETLRVDPGEATVAAIRTALETGGAVFIDEGDGQGLGVRLKWSAKDARQLKRMENEGGPVGDDDV